MSKRRSSVSRGHGSFQQGESGGCSKGDSTDPAPHCNSGTMQITYQSSSAGRGDYSNRSSEYQYGQDPSNSPTERTLQWNHVHSTAHYECSSYKGVGHGTRRRVQKSHGRGFQSSELLCAPGRSSHQHYSSKSSLISVMVADYQTNMAHSHIQGPYQQRRGGEMQAERPARRDVSRDDRRVPSTEQSVCSRERSVSCPLSCTGHSPTRVSRRACASQSGWCGWNRSCSRDHSSLGQSRRKRYNTYPPSFSSQHDKSCSQVHSESVGGGSCGLGGIQDITSSSNLISSSSLEEMIVDEYEHSDPRLFYTFQNIPGPGSDEEIFNETFSSGCDCVDSCTLPTCACLLKCGQNYSDSKKLLNFSSPIIECNDKCNCKINCNNRLVQKGPIFGLEVFDTQHKGLGLRCKFPIFKNQFICEYAGELIDENEARLRYSYQKNNYIIVINEHYGDNKVIKTCVDPSAIGNIGRYANHSCSATTIMMPVRSNSMVPHLALFAACDIKSGVEITFDYSGGGNKSLSNTPCLCASQNCKGFLPFEPSLL